MPRMQRVLAPICSVSLVLLGLSASAEEPAPPGGISDDSRRPASGFESHPPGEIDDGPKGKFDYMHKYGLGARVRYLFVTELMFAPYLASAKGMNGASFGIEFEYRKPNYDVVTSFDASFFTFDSGNWLGAGKDAAVDSKYTQFRGLNFFSLDVSIIGHRWLTPWMELRGGAGLGLGVVTGDVLVTANGTQCTLANVHDTTQCYPKGVGPITSDAQAEPALKKTESASNPPNLNTDPHRKQADKLSPVWPVLNILIGMRFKVHRHVLVGWELGFRNSMFVGLQANYLF